MGIVAGMELEVEINIELLLQYKKFDEFVKDEVDSNLEKLEGVIYFENEEYTELDDFSDDTDNNVDE